MFELRNTCTITIFTLLLHMMILCQYTILCQEFPAYHSEEEQDESRILPDGVNEGLYYGEGYAFYEHELEEEVDLVTCYTCHYSVTLQHEQGMINCHEPFNRTGIPQIQCHGSCAVTKTWLQHADFMIVRSCLPNCKNILEPKSVVSCCSGTLCNGERKEVYVVAASLGSVGVVFIMGLIFTVCHKGF